jgi:uncharacterized protein (DUF4415 family)
MKIKLKTGEWVHWPSDEEEAQINAGIAADPDTWESTDEEYARARPASEVLPPDVYAGLVAMQQRRARGRPPVETPKVATAIRFDADVLAGLRATGKGWQTRVNDAMRQWLQEHPAAEFEGSK